AELQQRGDTPARLDRAAGGVEYPADDLQQRRLSRAIAADDADGFPGGDVEGNILQRPEIAKVLPGRPSDRPLQARHHELLETIGGALVDLVTLADVADGNRDRVRGHRRIPSWFSGTSRTRPMRPPTPRADTATVRTGWAGAPR